jgi:hypothetical protein
MFYLDVDKIFILFQLDEMFQKELACCPFWPPSHRMLVPHKHENTLLSETMGTQSNFLFKNF